MLLWMYGMVGIIVWVWKCDCTRKQWREARVLAQARFVEQARFTLELSLKRSALI